MSSHPSPSITQERPSHGARSTCERVIELDQWRLKLSFLSPCVPHHYPPATVCHATSSPMLAVHAVPSALTSSDEWTEPLWVGPLPHISSSYGHRNDEEAIRVEPDHIQDKKRRLSILAQDPTDAEKQSDSRRRFIARKRQRTRTTTNEDGRGVSRPERPMGSRMIPPCVVIHSDTWTTIKALPDEVLMSILARLQPLDLIYASCVCQRWRILVHNPTLWMNLGRQLLGAESERENDSTDDPEEHNDHQVNVADCMKAVLWLDRQQKAHDALKARQRWSVKKDKWSLRLIWSAGHGYMKIVQQCLDKLNRLYRKLPPCNQAHPTNPASACEVHVDWVDYKGKSLINFEQSMTPILPGPSSGLATSVLLLDQPHCTDLDLFKQKALFAAMVNRRAEVVETLLDCYNAQITAPLCQANLHCGSRYAIGAMLDRLPSADSNQGAPFLRAATAVAGSLAINGRIAALQQLLERGFLTNDLFLRALEAGLLAAVSSGNEELTHSLLSAGADPNARTPLKNKPLLLKAINKNVNIVRLLFNCGARVPNEIDPHYQWRHTPLERAVSRGYVDVVRLLLDQGADPTIRIDLLSSLSPHFTECKLLVQKAQHQAC